MSDAPGSVRSDEVLTLNELQRRFAWGEHSVRKARMRGLKLRKFGSRKYVIGSDVLAFLRDLNGDGEGSSG